MKKKTILFVLIFLASTSLATAQKLHLPLKNNTILWEGNLLVQKNNTSTTELCNNIKNWIVQNTGSKMYNVSTEKSNDCLVQIEVSNILEPNGTFNDVELIYSVYFDVTDAKITYEIKDIYFKKAYNKYDVSTVYNGYLKDKPVVKEKNESKAEALKRHEYLMSLMKENISHFITEFNSYMNVTANAVAAN